jgi:ubiquinone/menaquinone biosynthesis C-methylase UbiE
MQSQNNRLASDEHPPLDSSCLPIKRQSRTTVVRHFFDQTQRYLGNNVNIEIRQRVVMEMVGNIRNVNILDLGCGNGSIALQFLNESNHLTLVDISQNMLEVAREATPPGLRTNVEYVNEDLALQVVSGKYDLVLCLGVLAHVDAVEATITKIADMLKVDGRCILQITDADRIMGKLTGLYCGLRNQLRGLYPIAMNKTGVRKVRSLASQVKMECLAERRYASPLPGMGRIPLTWRRKYQLLTLNTPWLSRHSAEVILLFAKIA